jgi:hypothetical protein
MDPLFVNALHNSAKLTREEIWSPEAPYRPSVRQDFAALPFLGFVGRSFVAGGVVLVASNGNSKEEVDFSKHESHDLEYIRLLNNFRNDPSTVQCQDLMEFVERDMKIWSLASTIQRVMDRLDVTMDEMAFLNAIPFSTKESPSGTCPAWANSVKLHLQPIVTVLKPSKVIWLGKAASDRAGRLLSYTPSKGYRIVSRQRNLSWAERLKDI